MPRGRAGGLGRHLGTSVLDVILLVPTLSGPQAPRRFFVQRLPRIFAISMSDGLENPDAGVVGLPLTRLAANPPFVASRSTVASRDEERNPWHGRGSRRAA
jgi:hypothetical protein